MKVTFVRQEPVADHITTFWFQPERPVRYSAGQYTELYLPHEHVDERRDKHWFTLSSSPTDPMLSITTKFAQDRSSSFKQTLQALAPGSHVHMAAPMGDFILPKDASIPLLFVAAGIGCTPFHSIIKYLQDHEESRDITLLYGVHNLEQIAFRDTFEKLGDHWHLVLDAPPPEWQGYTGHITTEIILENITDPQKQQVYISGPEPMVETLTKELDASGFPKNHIRTDYFPGYTEV
jgi:ferredoxin-NADP reductase